MLTRTATRRSAAVLMMALVAMLLVATGGSARATQARTSAGTGHVAAVPHAARQVAAVPVAPGDHAPVHLDLTSTPPVEASSAGAPGRVPALVPHVSHVPVDVVTAVGRAPPTV